MKKLKFILIVILISIGAAFKWVWKKIKGFIKWVFSKTTVDEKVVEVVEEVSDRVKVVREEIKDVKKALGEAVDQSQDIAKAAKGKKRRGRPKKS
jgi:cytoskeletal protein RodZ